jgi:cytidylate kinase
VSFVVTIDGPAAAGKSTTARGVAMELGFLYVDTGALYRALALRVLEEGIPLDESNRILDCVADSVVALSGSPDHPRVELDGRDVTREVRTPEVGETASRLAAQPGVRRRLVEVQRDLRERGPLVAEGRDLGTVVFPDADVKVYLDADLQTRAQRRYRELHERGLPVAREDVLAELTRRDRRDRERSESPLATPPDAHVLDTTGMDIEGQVAAVLDIVQAHPACPVRGRGA